MDVWVSARNETPRQLISDPTLPKPLEEATFNAIATESPLHVGLHNVELRNSSLWSVIIPLTEIYAEVITLNRRCVYDYDFSSSSKVQELSNLLDNWLNLLPLHLHDNPESHWNFIKQGLGQSFLVVHILYHYYALILYYQFLDKENQYREDTAVSAEDIEYSRRCKQHATALSDLMWRGRTQKSMECLWSPVNGHLLVVASSVHLHTLACSQGDMNTSSIIRMLEQNFIVLLELGQYYPSLENSMSRLRTFHRACQRKNAADAFDMDRWMLRFLNRYDQPMGDRDEADRMLQDTASISTTGDTPEILRQYFPEG